MSTLKVNNIQNANGTSAIAIDSSGVATFSKTLVPSQSMMFRNRIINGDMRIAQRGTGTVNPNGSYTYSVDRTAVYTPTSGIVTAGQSTASTPDNFTHSFLVTSTTTTSVGAGDINVISHKIEGNNIADLGWGTAAAKTVTLSFWVRSSLTGTFGGAFKNNANNRNYVFEYTISSADTWEQKTITITGDTTGTWESGTSSGIQLVWNLGTGSTYSGTAGSWGATNYFNATGSVNLVATSGATFYITGIQLEVGDAATPFEHRPYGAELALCQRYYEISYDIGTAPGTATNNGAIAAVSYNTSTNRPFMFTNFKVTKRAVPTVTPYNPATGTSGQMNGPSGTPTNSTVYYAGMNSTNFYAAVGTSTSNGDYYQQWTASAEL